MSSGLDPAILRKLEAFSQRRRKLIILRGIFAAIAMLLATMMAVALIDWLFVLPDWARWTLSAVAYLAVIITEWRACLRLLIHAPDPRRLARLIEHAEPKLREDLLSAVELGEGNAALDSEQFRHLVQADVASRLEGVDMDRLLPVQLLRRTIVLAAAVIVACVVAFAVSGFQFSTLLIRAMLPMANLARVSKVQVQIVEPSPADTLVAYGDSVPLIIDISGQRTNKAVLETFTASGEREIIAMTPVGPDRFSTNVQIARENVTYRIRAGDALTRKYELQARPRPHVVEFQKKYTYPAYSGLQPHSVTDVNGDVVGLEGSDVEIEIETDQPVKTAEIISEQGKQVATRALQPMASGRLGARVKLDQSGVYRVRLIAQATGFENKFSPEYELRAEPDLVPQIELELPKRDLIAPANEVIQIRGTASDDLGVAKVSQLTRVNEGPWKEESLSITPGKDVEVARLWDLYDQGLKAGDLLTFKLRVVDLKGHSAESRPVRISITASGFEQKRLTSLDVQRRLVASLKVLRTAAEGLEKRGREAQDQFNRLAEDDPLRKQAAASFVGSLEEFERIAATVADELQEVIKTATPGHSTGEFVMLGRLVGKLVSGTAKPIRDNLNLALQQVSAPYARELIREAADFGSRVAQRSRIAEESGRVLFTSESIDILNENIQVVAREQERIGQITESIGDDVEKWTALIPRLRVVLGQAKGLEEMLSASSEHGTDGSKERMRRMQKNMEEHRSDVDRVLESGENGKALQKVVEALTKETRNLERQAFDLKRDFMHPPARAAQTMLQDVQPTWMNFEKLRGESDALLRNGAFPETVRSELARVRWDAKGGIIKAHGDAEEVRADSDTYFVSDVRAVTLALTGMREPVLGVEKPFSSNELSTQAYEALDYAFRLLEGVHNLTEAHDGLIRLATAERWEVTALRARTANPRDWEWIESRLKAAPEELGRLKITEEFAKEAVKTAQKILREAQGDYGWRSVNEEMKQRMRVDATARGMAEETERVAALVKQALDALREPIQRARQTVAQMAPKLSELMAQLAKEAEKMKAKSEEQAKKTTEQKPEEAQAEARQQLARQQELNEKVDAVRDALRSEANKQDMFEKEGRERARDADAALAMLKEPPPKAEQALENAAIAAEAAQQQEALNEAAKEQEKLASALNQLAEHYDAAEKGNPEQTRMALREAEKELGIKEALDERYAREERMAQLAQSSPEEMLKQLEQALPQNPLMQKELSGIAKNTLKAASEKLTDASQRENAVAEQVEKLAAEQAARAQEQARMVAEQHAAAAQKAAAEKAAAERAAAEAGVQEASRMASQQTGEKPTQNTPAPGEPAAPAGPTKAQAQSDAGKMAQQADQSGQQPQNAQQPPQPGSDRQPGNEQKQAAPDPILAQAAGQQTPIAQAAMQAGEDVARAGRHEQRLQNTDAGKQLEQLGNEIAETAQNEVAQAQNALQNASQAEQARSPVKAASAELRAEAAQLAKVQAGEMQAGDQQSGREGEQKGADQAATSDAPMSPAQQSSKQDAVANQQPNGMKPGDQQPQPQNPAGENPTNQQSQMAATTGSQQAPQTGEQPSAESGEGQQIAAAQQSQSPHPTGSQPQQSAKPGQISPDLASPQEQVWMARTLDALDTALNATPSQQNQQMADAAGQQKQSGQQAGQQQQPGQQPTGNAQQQQQMAQNAEAMARAQQAMTAAAQAAAAQTRANRAQESKMQQPNSQVAQGGEQSKSDTGAMAEAGDLARGALPDAQLTRTNDWGKLPKKVADQLSQGQREAVAGEYRNQVETYYRVIAERAKKQ